MCWGWRSRTGQWTYCGAWTSRSREGSIFALLGSNGAGKTTLVRILATLLKADAGTARRQRVRRRHASRRACGSRSASPGSSPRWTTSSPGGRTSSWSRGCGTSGSGRDRRRAAAAVLADRGWRAPGRDVLGRHAPPARHRDEPDRRPAGDLPRRADHRPRPPRRGRGVADGPGARRRRDDRAAHHAVPGGGRATRRPDRDPAPGPDHRQRHPRRAQATATTRRDRVRREAALARGRLLRRRRRPTTHRRGADA